MNEIKIQNGPKAIFSVTEASRRLNLDRSTLARQIKLGTVVPTYFGIAGAYFDAESLAEIQRLLIGRRNPILRTLES